MAVVSKSLPNLLQTLLNFTSSVRQARDGTYGSMKPDGTWGGMVGEVMNQEHDLGMYNIIFRVSIHYISQT